MQWFWECFSSLRSRCDVIVQQCTNGATTLSTPLSRLRRKIPKNPMRWPYILFTFLNHSGLPLFNGGLQILSSLKPVLTFWHKNKKSSERSCWVDILNSCSLCDIFAFDYFEITRSWYIRYCFKWYCIFPRCRYVLHFSTLSLCAPWTVESKAAVAVGRQIVHPCLPALPAIFPLNA